jgi:hypothetical protein
MDALWIDDIATIGANVHSLQKADSVADVFARVFEIKVKTTAAGSNSGPFWK